MDPITFVWEVAKTLFGLIAAVVVPIGGLWLISRRQKHRRRRDRKPPTG
jgi:heme/copper-type cytochrome/quinol oxidase subunit 4